MEDVGGAVGAREAGGCDTGEFTKPVDRTLLDPVEERWTLCTLSVAGLLIVAPPTEVKGDSNEDTGCTSSLNGL